MQLENKTILITGASNGIGRSVALEFAKQGANIILLARNARRLNQTYDELSQSGSQHHLILEADLLDLNNETSQEIFTAINNEYPFLDGIIHNAAVLGTMTPLSDYDFSTWNDVIQTNLTAPFLLTKALKALLEKSQRPRIIFTSSGVANTGKSFWGAYSVSKFGIKGMAEIFADELEGTTNIKVFNFDPGATRTGMRASAYPAENPETIKSAKELWDCYLWFFSDKSEGSNQNYYIFPEPGLIK